MSLVLLTNRVCDMLNFHLQLSDFLLQRLKNIREFFKTDFELREFIKELLYFNCISLTIACYIRMCTRIVCNEKLGVSDKFCFESLDVISEAVIHF